MWVILYLMSGFVVMMYLVYKTWSGGDNIAIEDLTWIVGLVLFWPLAIFAVWDHYKISKRVILQGKRK